MGLAIAVLQMNMGIGQCSFLAFWSASYTLVNEFTSHWNERASMGLLGQVLGNASKIDAAEVQNEFALGPHIDLTLNAETQRTRSSAERVNIHWLMCTERIASSGDLSHLPLNAIASFILGVPPRP